MDRLFHFGWTLKSLFLLNATEDSFQDILEQDSISASPEDTHQSPDYQNSKDLLLKTRRYLTKGL